MKQIVLNMMEEVDLADRNVTTSLSFKSFIRHLRNLSADDNSSKQAFYKYALEKIDSVPELESDIRLDRVGEYKEILDLLFALLVPVAEDEQKIYWGLCMPMTPVIFYGSELLYDLIKKANSETILCSIVEDRGDDGQYLDNRIYEHFYSFILERFYGIHFRKQNELTRTITDADTNLSRHVRVHLNTQFVEVNVIGELPEINLEIFRNPLIEKEVIELLLQLLPINMFSFSGFSITTITDITAEYALESIKNNIVAGKEAQGRQQFPIVVRALKEMVGIKDIEFNVLPLYRINGKLVNDMDEYSQSIILSIGKKNGLNSSVCMPLVESFLNEPKLVYLKDIGELPATNEISQLLHAAGLKSYGLIPVFFQDTIIGALEVYSYKMGLLSEQVLGVLEPAKNLIAQLIQNSITAFDDAINAVIKEKFTALQPAVQWKFNEVAWQYLQKEELNLSTLDTEEIVFEKVFPLYGAVDIRNSTLQRNEAMNKDLHLQFSLLIDVLQELKLESGFGLIDEKIYLSQKWLEQIKNNAAYNQIVKLNDFLQNNIIPFLVDLRKGDPLLSITIEKYLNGIDEKEGMAYKHRRLLESSMNTVIGSINQYFELMKVEVQRNYPCYFEKFRTDGVEYDIYIGQSIAPDKPFSEIYLKNLRLMQVSSMAAIAKYGHSLVIEMEKPVEITQLIFIHSHTIDIKFRKDEKRFDVEGAYNIRYHIIKKRIDKVLLKDSKERLTQPGKIALVYFNQQEADEYIGFIRYLQEQNILTNDLEELELENLQGVSGLKALRVGVNLV